jgi:STAM-binding protein
MHFWMAGKKKKTVPPFLAEHDLLMLGWIHTHPRQSLFCSSLDLHTHHGYQLMLREAIAVVMAPAQAPNYGIFRIIEPEGMAHLGRCTERGFHRHENVPIYEYATHVRMTPGVAGHRVYDLRA